MLATSALLAASAIPAQAQSAAAAGGDVPHADVPFNDGLAIPMPANPSLGKGKDRALVLGGGGEYFAAWMLGFMHGLHENGVGYEMPDVIIGTSAGSVVGSTIAGGHLAELTRDFDFFGAFPKLLGALVPTPTPNPSQMRAHDLCNTATNASLETIQAIGRGAMAARNPRRQTAGYGHRAHRQRALAERHFPRHDHGLLQRRASRRVVQLECAHLARGHSSMSLPGIFGPTWVGDRVCMDGGMGPSSTHSDLVAGAKRAIIVSLTDGSAGERAALLQHAQLDPARRSLIWRRPAPRRC